MSDARGPLPQGGKSVPVAAPEGDSAARGAARVPTYRLDLGGTRGPLVSVTLADLPPGALVVELDGTLSKNRSHRVVNGRPILSAACRAYREAVGWQVLAQTTPEERDALVGHRLEVMAWVRHDGKRRWDGGNCWDELSDALFPALGIDDSAVWTHHMIRVDPEVDPLAPACRVAIMRR